MNIEQARFNMIEQQIRPCDVLDSGVLSLLGQIKREDFVPEAYQELAFADLEIPLTQPIKAGRTLLAPKIEARILQELAIRASDTVLEIGTGSGFMAALLAAKAEFVYSVEIEPELVERARQNLQRAGAANVSVDLGDAAQGWSLYAPYDVIVLSGSLPVLPESILRDLKIGGRLMAVVGDAPVMQLQHVTRTGEHDFSTVILFETQIAPLDNATRRNRFVF